MNNITLVFVAVFTVSIFAGESIELTFSKGGLCKGVPVSENKIITVDYCYGGSDKVQIAGMNSTSIIYSSFHDNGLVLLELSQDIPGGIIETTSTETIESIEVNNQLVEVCGIVEHSQLDYFPAGDGGSSIGRNAEGVVTALLYSVAKNIGTDSIFYYGACISQELIDQI